MNCNPALHTNCEVLKEVIPSTVVETLGELRDHIISLFYYTSVTRYAVLAVVDILLMQLNQRSTHNILLCMVHGTVIVPFNKCATFLVADQADV